MGQKISFLLIGILLMFIGAAVAFVNGITGTKLIVGITIALLGYWIKKSKKEIILPRHFWKKTLLIILILAILYFGITSYLANSKSFNEKIRYCEADSDCVPVRCACSCDGWGTWRQDAVNKDYVSTWDTINHCNLFSPRVCNSGPSCKSIVLCENNQCVKRRLLENN